MNQPKPEPWLPVALDIVILIEAIAIVLTIMGRAG
jgi:hypothetical protein